METAFYLSALGLGFIGSFHCAGMCGPLVFMLPNHDGSPDAVFKGRFIYNSGRVITYMTIGLLFGLFGLALALKGFQRELSVLTGVIILLTVIITSGKKQRLMAYSLASSYTNPVKKLLKKHFIGKSYFSLFLIGALNGLLPCGFVYLATAGAASAGSIPGSLLYMALFGLGTFPVMMTISVAANYLGIKFKILISKISPIIAIALALFLIYRGTDMKTDNSHRKTELSNIPCPVVK